MTIRFVYQIEGPIPPEKEGFGYWGFSAMLDREFALKLRGIEMDERNRVRFDKEGRDMIVKYELENRGMVTPYRFVDGSWLLDGIVVPGNSCDLSLKCHHREAFIADGLEKERKRIEEQIGVGDSLLPIAYMPHNIDDMEQAFCLSSLFNNWVNMANSVFNSD